VATSVHPEASKQEPDNWLKAEANEEINYSDGQSGMGFLNLLRLPEPVDWNPSRLSQFALVRSLNLMTQSEGDNDELKQCYAKKNKQRPKWRKFLQRCSRPHDPMLVLNILVFNFEPAWNRVFQSTETTRERLGMKTGGRPTFPEMSHSKLGR
jgi:hypothetical protein